MSKPLFLIEEKSMGFCIRMASNMENIDRASVETQAFLHRHGLDSLVFSICLGMREALTNAVRHGNAGNPAAIITYHLNLTDKSIVLEVLDQGTGFNWRSPPKNDPHAENGRGIHIMKNYFNLFTYNEKGNHLILEKHIPQRC